MCHRENPDAGKSCRECGSNLRLVCPKCGTEQLVIDKFCGDCGQKLEQEIEIERPESTSEGERKHVTVLLSDLSGYTAMSEKLDPEEVKEITGRIFSDISKIIANYNCLVFSSPV